MVDVLYRIVNMSKKQVICKLFAIFSPKLRYKLNNIDYVLKFMYSNVESIITKTFSSFIIASMLQR